MTSILDYLEFSTAQFPDKIAVRDEIGQRTYTELTEYSRRVGTALASYAAMNHPVIVFMEKGIPALTTFFGTVYAGGFYCLMNPELPESRLLQVQSVLKAGVLVTNAQLRDRAAQLFPQLPILLEEELEQTAIDETVLSGIRARRVDTDPLYVNFTSGSTGVPKGIAVCHRSVIDFINVFTERFGFVSEDIIANQAPFDFDVSVKDIYSAIKVGATLVIVPKRFFSAPVDLLDYLCANEVTTMTWAVSALCLISTFHGLDYKTPSTVKKVLFSGEVMPKKHLDSWMSHLPDTMFVNLYGPTEITCNCTYHIVDRNRDYSDGLPIGKAFPNEDVFLLDGENRPVTEPEQVGEICVRGTALALGYYCAPEQTAKSFVQNPLNTCYPELIYRTGDLGRMNGAGEFVFCGRKDFQIKHMGHRIELEEIERAISAVDGVEHCCCVFEESKSRLSGYYVGTVDKKTLHGKLKETLPVYMVPGRLRQIEAMPLTKNGKADRKALLAMNGGKKA